MTAYLRVPPTLTKRASYRDPDDIRTYGGTCEALEQALRRARYYPAGMPKIETARRIAAHMDPDRNKSKSFQVFRDGLRDLVASG